MSAQSQNSGTNTLMGVLSRFMNSSIGMKLIMAVTGIGLWGFVLIHMLGNLQIFAGDGGEAINAYGAMLKSMGGVLWVARLSLLGIAGLHIVTGIRLASRNKKARGPKGYQTLRTQYGNPLSRFVGQNMKVSGLIILAFIIIHLLHFTTGTLVSDDIFHSADAQGRHNIFNMVTQSFSNIVWVLFYAFANLMVVGHLMHGTQSLWQTLGIKSGKWGPTLEKVGLATAVLILLCNVILLPFGVFLMGANS